MVVAEEPAGAKTFATGGASDSTKLQRAHWRAERSCSTIGPDFWFAAQWARVRQHVLAGRLVTLSSVAQTPGTRPRKLASIYMASIAAAGTRTKMLDRWKRR